MSFKEILLAAFIISSIMNIALMFLGVIDMYSTFKRNSFLIMGSFLTIGGFYKQLFTNEPNAYWVWIPGLIIVSLGLIWLWSYYKNK